MKGEIWHTKNRHGRLVTITAEKLNHMEEGIGSCVMVCTQKADDEMGYLYIGDSKVMFDDVVEAISADRLVIVKVAGDAPNNQVLEILLNTRSVGDEIFVDGFSINATRIEIAQYAKMDDGTIAFAS